MEQTRKNKKGEKMSCIIIRGYLTTDDDAVPFVVIKTDDAQSSINCVAGLSFIKRIEIVDDN